MVSNMVLIDVTLLTDTPLLISILPSLSCIEETVLLASARYLTFKQQCISLGEVLLILDQDVVHMFTSGLMLVIKYCKKVFGWCGDFVFM